jgi:K+-sensing histidine kinase KdpD
MDWAQILVILLAILFAVFLIVGIILAVLIIKISRQIKAATESAERTVAALEGSVKAFNKTALPLMVTKGIMRQVLSRSRKNGRKDERE